MTIRELAIRRVIECGMSEDEAGMMIKEFAAGAGKLFGWEGIAPELSPTQIERIDRAAFGWCTRNRLIGETNNG